MESSKKEITTINEGMLKNATTKITQFHKIAKNAITGCRETKKQVNKYKLTKYTY